MVEMTPQQAFDNQGKINNTLMDEIVELKRKMDKLEKNKNKKKLINMEGKSLD